MKRVLLAGLLALVGLVVTAPADAAACSGNSGVTVVVQFPDHTEIGCASGDPGSGIAALQGAGFTPTYATGDGAGAICKLNGQPTDAVCGRMPPANAYWAYFHAKPGGAWTYSNLGASAYDPAPGSVDGWRFGSGTAPSTPPPGGTTTTPSAKPTAKPSDKPIRVPVIPPSTPASVAAQATGGSAGSSGGTSATPTTGTTSPSASSSTSSTTSTATASSTATSTAEAVSPVTGSLVTAKHKDGSGSLSWLWGIGLLAVLGAGGALAVLRRRRT